ncbi:hypothetical protein CC1G_02740 [Coprinopsis cinerea okayama7|uniref:GOLD domain-containing protein n=1 Tax=Coprinopsis cinerea (strain Okayama-7 / 130 / ATCC MYA-4618 / FGSC 9003) TaxID=240176 RepID=A8MZX5_COPC7|nr:hypothetical protein CC1G_02740 [Coprinopsis cinerea okayama7\|eukprot:XP_001828159.2 hypothetical protein CC1G_02740 [Coprinopsis cinerea okayama7\
MRCSVFRSSFPSFPLLLPLPLLLSLSLFLVLSHSPTPTSALRITVLGDPLQIKVNEPTLVRWQHEPSDPPGFDFRFVIDERDVGLARANIVVDRPMDDEGFVDVRFPRPGIYEIKAVAGPGPRFRVIGTSNEVVVSRAAATTTTSTTSSSTSSSTTSTSSSPTTSTTTEEPLTDPARAGLIAGLILGSLILICLLVLLTIFVLRHRRIANEKSARLSFYPEQMVQAAPSRGGNGGDGSSAGGGGNTLEGGGGGGGIGGLARRTMSERRSKFLSRLTMMTRSLSFSSSSAGAGDLEQGIITNGGANGRAGLRNSSIANIITPFPPPSELPPPPTPSTRTSDGTVQHPPGMVQVPGAPVSALTPVIPASAKPTVVSFAATIASPRGVVFTNPFETPAEREARELSRRATGVGVGVVRPLPTPPVVPTGPVPSSSIITPPVSAGALRPLPQVPQPPSPAPPLTVRDSVHRPPSTPQPRKPLPLPVLPPITATPPLSMVQLQLEGSRHRALPSVPASGSNMDGHHLNTSLVTKTDSQRPSSSRTDLPSNPRDRQRLPSNPRDRQRLPSNPRDRQRLLEDRLHAVQERIEEEEFRARVRLSEEMSLRSLGVHVPEGVPASGGISVGKKSKSNGNGNGVRKEEGRKGSSDSSGRLGDVDEDGGRGGGVWTPLMETLKEEREWLESALESEWARGRSDEVPCGYSRYMVA